MNDLYFYEFTDTIKGKKIKIVSNFSPEEMKRYKNRKDKLKLIKRIGDDGEWKLQRKN